MDITQLSGLPLEAQVDLLAFTSFGDPNKDAVFKAVDKALSILAFSPKKGAAIIKEVLESAIANAEHNDGADIDELTVKKIYVDKATNLRRFTARQTLLDRVI